MHCIIFNVCLRTPLQGVMSGAVGIGDLVCKSKTLF